MNDCSNFETKIDDYIGEDMAGGDFLEHIASCESCRSLLSERREFAKLMSSAEEPVPEEFSKAWRAKLHAAPAPSARRRFGRYDVARIGALAAALFIGIAAIYAGNGAIGNGSRFERGVGSAGSRISPYAIMGESQAAMDEDVALADESESDVIYGESQEIPPAAPESMPAPAAAAPEPYTGQGDSGAAPTGGLSMSEGLYPAFNVTLSTGETADAATERLLDTAANALKKLDVQYTALDTSIQAVLSEEQRVAVFAELAQAGIALMVAETSAPVENLTTFAAS